MKPQDFKSIQEAYLEVYQLDEGLSPKQIEKIARQAAGKTKKSPAKLSSGMREDADIYDIILSHLLDEGYAETPESAEAIMVNMSEDWRDSVVEAYKDLPVGKMIRKAGSKQFKSGVDAGYEIGKGKNTPETNDRSSRYSKHIGKMSAVASMHDPERAQAKSKLKKG